MDSEEADPHQIPPDKVGQDAPPLAHAKSVPPNENVVGSPDYKPGDHTQKRIREGSECSPSKRVRLNSNELNTAVVSSLEFRALSLVVEEVEKLRRRILKLRDNETARIEALDARLFARDAAVNAYKFSTSSQHYSVEVSRALYASNFPISKVQMHFPKTPPAAMSRLSEDTDRILSEEQTLRRMAEITRKNGNMAKERLPKQPEAAPSKAHWDYLLEEMVGMSSDFREERRWKRALAAKVSNMVVEYWSKRTIKGAVEKSILQAAQERECRMLASNIAMMVKQFWYNSSYLDVEAKAGWSRLQTTGEQAVDKGPISEEKSNLVEVKVDAADQKSAEGTFSGPTRSKSSVDKKTLQRTLEDHGVNVGAWRRSMSDQCESKHSSVSDLRRDGPLADGDEGNVDGLGANMSEKALSPSSIDNTVKDNNPQKLAAEELHTRASDAEAGEKSAIMKAYIKYRHRPVSNLKRASGVLSSEHETKSIVSGVAPDIDGRHEEVTSLVQDMMSYYKRAQSNILTIVCPLVRRAVTCVFLCW
eukprot:Plantae.Rhodophyta-Purpureofilum_apyrenoidigerum.ctg6720.p1 GENE.Plantae.Rhodophyta-Purpureofilum_apyrenoidigerum.ctg6720~~Plantae.Rhodophyta-Purpureofilum_apyrenoidigerum.ctg6720.p1  ORF type:complete len:533 (-),score=86.69 Plantae.Rhodophyta-Purpureofilum_apyrenoidigerum.ctg6720:119-1717(-)